MNGNLKRILFFNLNDILRPFVYGFIAVALMCLPLAFSIGLVGGGHGSGYYCGIVLSPFSNEHLGQFVTLWIPFWVFTGMLISWRRRMWARIAAAAMLVVHYAGIPLLMAETNWRDVDHVWDVAAGSVVLFWCAYSVVQSIFWISILRTEPWPFESR